MRTPDGESAEVLPEEKEKARQMISDALGPVPPSGVSPETRALLSRLMPTEITTSDFYMVFVWCLLAPILTLLMLWQWASGGLLYALLYATLLGLILRFSRVSAQLDQAKAALRVAEFPNIAGPLIEGLEFVDPRVPPTAALVLINLLPKMTREQADRLTERQRAILYRRLRPEAATQNVELTLAILRALENTGGEEAVPHVERLAEGMVWMPEARRVRTIARAVLPRLEARLQEEARLRAAGDTELPLEEAAPQTPETRRAAGQVTELLTQLDDERRTHRQPGMWLSFLIASWVCIVPFCAAQFLVNWGDWPLTALWASLTLAATQLHRLSLSHRQTEAARKLASSDDVAGVGPLAEALEWPDPEIKSIAADALTRLLPRLQASDTNLLNKKQRAALYRTLRMSNANAHEVLMRAILRALEQVGDLEAVPYVQRLAETRVILNSRQRRVKEAAEECLPLLNERARDNSASMTLLRASSSSEMGNHAEVLLRPAVERADTAPEQLLRPTSTTPEELPQTLQVRH